MVGRDKLGYQTGFLLPGINRCAGGKPHMAEGNRTVLWYDTEIRGAYRGERDGLLLDASQITIAGPEVAHFSI